MSKNQKPNLFSYATSELSHDAFIAWVLSWSDPSFKDEPLNSFSQFVLKDFFDVNNVNFPGIQKVRVLKQYKNIDVLVLVTDDLGSLWAIIVENKMHTSEHSKQLERYRENIHKDENLSDITDSQIMGIYYKMWEQSDIRRVKESEFSHFGRRHMLKLLKERYKTGISDVVDQYQNYLISIQDELDAFKTKPISDWNGAQWTGFYANLKHELKEGDFGYVPNPSGGFMGFWFGGCDIEKNVSLYVQSEEGSLCFKVHITEPKYRQLGKWFWHKAVVEAGEILGLEIVKPKVMRIGQWFTIGVLKTKNNHPWMVIDDDEKIDLSFTVKLASKAANVVKYAARNKTAWLNSKE